MLEFCGTTISMVNRSKLKLDIWGFSKINFTNHPTTKPLGKFEKRHRESFHPKKTCKLYKQVQNQVLELTLTSSFVSSVEIMTQDDQNRSQKILGFVDTKVLCISCIDSEIGKTAFQMMRTMYQLRYPYFTHKSLKVVSPYKDVQFCIIFTSER